VAERTLVFREAARFPKIPGVELPGYVYQAHRLDFGPSFPNEGVVAFEPPGVGKLYASLVPQVDEDGNETAGVRMPEIDVPLATYTGWNFRDAATGAPDILAGNVGSFFPFARSREDRTSRGDPRPAIEERYRSRDAYVQRFHASAERLVAEGFVRKEDVDRMVIRAGERWDLQAAKSQ
jgi:hypothetical protein